MTYSDEQIEEEIGRLRKEQEREEEEMVKLSVYSDGQVSVFESYSMPIPTRELLVKVMKEKSDKMNNNKQ